MWGAADRKGGILFAFSSDGLAQPRDFVRNAARTVKDGLAADAAVRALTINAARIAGAGDRLGSLEKGKIANVIVTDGDLFEDRTRIVHVFVDGRTVEPEPAAPQVAAGGAAARRLTTEGGDDRAIGPSPEHRPAFPHGAARLRSTPPPPITAAPAAVQSRPAPAVPAHPDINDMRPPANPNSASGRNSHDLPFA